jgi:hypothetical protein
VPLNERPGDASPVGDQGCPAFVGGLLAGEQEQSGRVRHARSVGVRVSSASVKAA